MLDEKSGSVTFELASFGSRVIATLIDGVILLFVSFVVGSVTLWMPDWMATILGFVLNFIYHWYFWTRRDGQTPGKIAVNIRVIKIDGSPITSMDSLVRVVGYTLSGLPVGLGYLWALFDANSQTWHDKIANTYVVVANKQKREVRI